MTDRKEPGATVVELMLPQPEMVARLEDYRHEPDEAADDDEPTAA
jgi:hypothetical protein